jgi:alpha-galactosidase
MNEPRELKRAGVLALTLRNFGLRMLATATLAAASVLAQESNSAPASGNIVFKGCYASWDEKGLTAGNSLFERKWIVRGGQLKAASFRTKNPEREWLAAVSDRGETNGGLKVSASQGQTSTVEAESLQLRVAVLGGKARRYELRVFPDTAGTLLRVEETDADAGVPANAAALPKATGVESAPTVQAPATPAIGMEELVLEPQHLRLTQVALVDQTDIHNELASEREWLLSPNEERLQCSGNLIFLENVIDGSGLVFLKVAPLPHARQGYSGFDFTVNPRARQILAAPSEYPVAVLAYRGGRWGRMAALHQFQRQLRVPAFPRDGVFLSNTWGDRSRDARINEAFILKEIEAGARLGVDVVQIDDGWQKGRSSNSARRGGVWSGFWAADPRFWEPDPERFPRGLEPVAQAARTRGMRLGLWFAPDSSRDATNWQRDADRLLELHREQGIDYFKIDSLNTGSALAAANAKRLFARVLDGSHGQVVLDLDVTAGQRSGYFGRPEIGPIFVENRYTDFHNYWPHQTLRNLWLLSQYVDPLRLRVEFLNNARSQGQYRDDPLAPAAYSPDCLFAMVMFANPLGWFEVSNLPQDYQDSAAGLIRRWKQERERLYAGTILPIGAVPDGVSWTGFASVGAARGGYVVIFRELCSNSEWTVTLSMFPSTPRRVAVLGGEGAADLKNGQLRVRIPRQLHYLWVRVD